jgi:hypothetical protein
MSTREPLPGFDDRAPSGRYCDLILTGGVTSSIAYPAAIFAPEERATRSQSRNSAMPRYALLAENTRT